MAQYCTREVFMAGTDVHAAVPVFTCVKTLVNSWCHNTGISIADTADLERFLNGLGIGIFTVTGNSTAGVTITTENNNTEFTEAIFTVDAVEGTANFAEDGCSDNPIDECADDCFEGLIGMRDVCEPLEPKNCNWINDIGISRFTLEQLITKDYEGAEDFFTKQYNHAVNEVVQTIHTKFSTKYVVNSIIEGERLGFVQDNLQVKVANNKYSGIFVEFINNNSFVDFYLSGLSLITNFTGTIPVKVYDAFEGRQIDTINVSCETGKQSTVYPNKKYSSQRKSMKLLFAYDTTGINSYKTLIKNNLCCGKNSCSNQYISAKGAHSSANTFIDSDVITDNHTHGMSLVYSLQCNHRQWLCTHLNLLSVPLMYKLASNILLFGITASPDQRITNKTNIFKEQLVKDQAFFEAKWGETMESVLGNIQTPSDAKCFQCRDVSGTKLVLP